MSSLLKTEWLKLRKYRAFWWMVAIIALTYPGINYFFFVVYKEFLREGGTEAKMMMEMLMGSPFSFPEVWHTVAYASSVFVIIPSIVVIMFITNEYTYKTHRQNIIDGWSRDQFMLSKMADVFIVAIITTLLYLLTALIIGIANNEEAGVNQWAKSEYIGYFFLQTFSHLSLAFFIAFLTRKAFIALGIFIFYKLILEKILVGLADWKLNDAGRFLPFEVSNRLIPFPAFFGKFDPDGYQESLDAVNYHIIYSLIMLALVWLLCFSMNRKRDL